MGSSRNAPKRRVILAGFCLGTAAVALPVAAHAQSVNYSELQELFNEPVTTSVTGKPQRASEAPAGITIITRDEIARSPARDVPGLLRSYAGIDVNQWTAGQSDVAVRGGVQVYNPRLLVMVNGRQVYLDHYGMTDWNLLGIQLEEIQQIELIRGPATALFGFNAASGVVNIITVNETGNHLTASAEVGNHGISDLSAVASIKLGEGAGFRLSAGRLREDERAIPETHFDPEVANPGVQRDEVSGTFTAKPGQGNYITLNAGYARNRQIEYISGPILAEVRLQTATLGGTATHDTGWGSIDGSLSANWLHFLNPSTNKVPGGLTSRDVDGRNRVVVGKGSILARLGSETTLRIGGEYRTNRLRGASLSSFEIRYDVLSASAMLDVHPTERLALTAAGRIDRLSMAQSGPVEQPVLDLPGRFDNRFTELSFNGAVLVKIGADGQLRFNGGRGIQAPSLMALGMHVVDGVPGVPFPIVIGGDPQIRPAVVWSGEVGYAQPLGSHFKLDAGAFYTRIDSFVALPGGVSFTFSPTGQPLLVGRFANIGDLKSYGVELSLAGGVGRWTGHLNYTWARADDSGLAATGYFINAGQAMPRHKVNAEVSHDAGGWFATATGRYTTSTIQLATEASGVQGSVIIPSAFALDGKLGWRIMPSLTLSIAGENLTKARGAAGSPIWADRRLRVGIRVAL